MNSIKITKSNFEQEVLKSDKPVLLDFWATWCMPCKMISPVVEEIAKEVPDIKVGKINIDEQPELASTFNVMSIPTLAVMKEGKIIKTMVGVKPKSSILKMLA
ncbi:MAG TPA: thioredoxin [Clostridiales bacterium]|nr:thioredoxin [Clostridiales bacterium]